MSDKPTRDELSRRTPEGIPLKTVYGPDDALRQRLPRPAALHARPLCDDVRRAAVDHPPICRLLDRRGIQRFLPPQPRRRAEGPERRLRSRHPPRLRQRQSARRRRRRHGRRRDRHRRGHEVAVRRHPARRDVGQHDDERRGAAGDGLLHRRRRGAGSRARDADRHHPERHPERVRGPQHLHLPARAEHADRRRRDRLLRGRDAAVQLDLDQRLSHARGRGDGGAGACLHARRRHGICARGDGQRASTSTLSRRA